MTKPSYLELLRDPRWQKKRLEIMKRDDFTCIKCGITDTELHIHHKYYISNRFPWDYPQTALSTRCNVCHKIEHESTVKVDPEFLGMQHISTYINTIVGDLL